MELPEDLFAAAIASGDAVRLREALDGLPAEEVPRILSRLAEADRARVFSILPAELAAGFARGLEDALVAGSIGSLPLDQAAGIVEELPSGDRVDVLAEMTASDAEAIVDRLPPEEARDVRELRRHSPDTAGGVMGTEVLSFPESSLVDDVVRDLRARAGEVARYEIQYAYVVSPQGPLVGVLRLRDLLLSSPEAPISGLMVRNPVRVRADAPLSEVKAVFDRSSLLGVPVVDGAGRLLGVVSRSELDRAREEEAGTMFLRASGVVGGEELRSLPLRPRVARRLSWLSVNILLNVLAASVIASYQDTLSAVIALAVFLPIISDMSGCSGNQAVAVSLRELTLGLLRPREVLYVVVKELQVGILNGFALGLLLGLVAFAWKGNVWLALVVGLALALNTVISVIIGGAVPLVLKGLRQDPALAAGPILTTITDTCGFFLVLGGASLVLHRLTG